MGLRCGGSRGCHRRSGVDRAAGVPWGPGAGRGHGSLPILGPSVDAVTTWSASLMCIFVHNILADCSTSVKTTFPTEPSLMILVLAALLSQFGEAPMTISDDACPAIPANVSQGQGQRDPNSRGMKERARAQTVPVELKDKPVTCRLVPVPEKTGAPSPPLPEIARQLQPG